MAKKKFHIPNLDDSLENEEPPVVKSHFKPGQIQLKPSNELKSINIENTSTASVIKQAKSDHLEEKANFGATSKAEIISKPLGNGEKSIQVGKQKTDDPDDPVTIPMPSTSKVLVEQQASSRKCIMVNNRQKGNPLLKNIRNVPWEFCEIEPDYIMSPTVCALFLSLRYHNLYPQYIHERLKSLGKGFQLRVLLIHIDVSDPFPPLKDLAKIAVLTDCTLLLAWSADEAGKIIETYKMFENKSPDMIMERQESDVFTQVIDSLSSIRSINRTDATTLLSTFGTLEKLSNALPEELSLCPGMGLLKAKRLHKLFRTSFIEDRT